MRYLLSFLSMALLCALPSLVFAEAPTSRSFVLWAGSASADSCITAKCHAVFGRAKHVHLPVAEGDCMVCHKADEKPHPGTGTIGLIEDEPGLCLQCHENPAEGMAFPHSVVEEGCTGCHNAHQGDLPNYVPQSGGKLCLSCHEDVTDGQYVHGPVKAENCQLCHGIHGGQHAAMLKLQGQENCLSCHAGIKTIMDNAVSQHEPVANGACWDCHAPHSSDYKPFLKAFYTQKLYTPYYESRNFALCFNCHDETAFTYDLTSEVTEFRNRYQNLHYFHVNRSRKGRVCGNCHGVHGADQEKLLMSKVPGFGKWEIPLTWVSDGEKSTCYVGCHRPKTYSPLRKIKNR